MSDIIEIPGVRRFKRINLETRLGTPIENSQSEFITRMDLAVHQECLREYTGQIRRNRPSPCYNCHGMTFASSRTTVYQQCDLDRIIKDDGYEHVTEDQVLPGDVILYHDEVGEAIHSGIVVERNEDLKVFRVWSKWGFGAEWIHWHNQCPYDCSRVRFFRITRHECPIR